MGQRKGVEQSWGVERFIALTRNCPSGGSIGRRADENGDDALGPRSLASYSSHSSHDDTRRYVALPASGLVSSSCSSERTSGSTKARFVCRT